MKVSMFKSAISKKSIGTVLLKDWLLTSNSYSSLIKELREEENQARKKEIKDLLPAITVSCVCSERLNDCIIGYTNLICIDGRVEGTFGQTALYNVLRFVCKWKGCVLYYTL